jgi:hypothetical protein
MRPLPLLLLLLAQLSSGSTSSSSSLLTFCDLKRALCTSAALVPPLLPTLVSSMHCSGLRIPLLPQLASPGLYPAAFNVTLAFAAEQGLTVYASPMEGAWEQLGSSEPAYAAWVAAFASAFRPSHLSVFNEVGQQACDGACMERVVVAVRHSLQQQQQQLPLFVGPDAEHVSASVAVVASRHQHLGVFDILSSHNAGADASNRPEAWAQLAQLAAGRQLWSSENPACFQLPQCTVYGSMAVAVQGGNVSAVVAWNALGDDAALNGSLTEKGQDIAQGW